LSKRKEKPSPGFLPEAKKYWFLNVHKAEKHGFIFTLTDWLGEKSME
jgi:hypothetical protein